MRRGLLAFGIGGMIIVYFVAPFLDNYFRKIKLQIIIPVCVALMVISLQTSCIQENILIRVNGINQYEGSWKIRELCYLE